MDNLYYCNKNGYFFNGEEPDDYGKPFKPEWEINPALKSAVLDNMPKDLSIEEQAIYIYLRLAYILKYDEGYMYKYKISMEERKKYESRFLKDEIESLAPGSVTTCYNFSRLYAKFITDLGNSKIKPFYKMNGYNRGHASTGFITDDAIVELDSVLITENKQSNDLLNLKIGAVPDGISIVSDKNHIIPNAVEKLYPIATLGKSPSSFQLKLMELRGIADKISPDKEELTLEDKLQAFSKILKAKGIVGNEAVQLLINYNKYGFFDDNLKIALCAEKSQVGPERRNKFTRKALIRINNGDNSVSTRSKYDYFMFDTQSLDVTKVDPDEISMDFVASLYTFESERQEIKMPELDEGGWAL